MYLGNEKIDPKFSLPEDTDDVNLGFSITAELTKHCIEDQERFIFECIEPFCSTVAKVAVIEKKLLEEIITKQMSIMPQEDGRCSRCRKVIDNPAAVFCEHCGQRMREDPET